MRETARYVVVVVAILACACALAARPPAAPATDPRVAQLLREVSADRIEGDIARLAAFGTRHALSATDHPTRGIGAAQRWVVQELKGIAATSSGRLRVEEDTFTAPAGARLPRAAEVTNLVATLPGTDAERILVVSAHLDSRASNPRDGAGAAPGANDNGSGVAAILEMARAIAPQSFRATLVFLLTGGEEQGLLGSRHWAEAARQAGRGLEGVLNNDIIGGTRGANGVRDDRRVRLFSDGFPPDGVAAARRAGLGENDSRSRQLARAVADAQQRYLRRFAVSLVFRRDRYSRGGDHLSFSDRGYAAVRFTEMNEDLRHQHQDVRVREGVQYGDLPEFVDTRYVANVARVNLAALADLAWAPLPPARVRLQAARDGGARLRWETPADPDRLGFEVLWRATTAPEWQGGRFVGEAGEATLAHSRDDFVLAVRAVSRAGNRGLPVVAGPGGPARGGAGASNPDSAVQPDP